jgi:hypothetical protein
MLTDFQKLAIDKVRDNASYKTEECRIYLDQICKQFGVNIEKLIDRILKNPVTLNFHPDRFSNNSKTVIENLLEQGQYQGQFLTGTTNGGKTAFIGGDRFLWEQRIFYDAYPDNSLDRPKYGALNIFRYIDGASVRFGSCYLTLKKETIDRCTFAYGDSSTNPTTLCTSDTFVCVLAELFRDVKKNGKLLNQIVSSEQETLAILLNKSNSIKVIGRNLDYCIETHIHGDVWLKDDVDSFYMDESFRDTEFAPIADELCHKYKIKLEWIPKRQIKIEEIGELFRGPKIPTLAKKIDILLGHNQGIMNAALLGKASRESELHPEKWADIGNRFEVFQYIKQLWHTIGYFG